MSNPFPHNIKIIANGELDGTRIVDAETGAKFDFPCRYIKWEQRWSGEGSGSELGILTLEVICPAVELEITGEKEIVETTTMDSFSREFQLRPKKAG